MKALLFILIWPSFATAGVYNCGSAGLKDSVAKRAYGFLSSIQGRFQLGRCFVQLQMCDAAQAQDNGSVVGDLVVTDRYNQSFYVPFDFSAVQTVRTRKVFLNGRRMVHYEYIDRIPDSSSGREEAYRLEILKSDDLTRVERIELGVYTSRLRRKYPHLPKAKSYWVICTRG